MTRIYILFLIILCTNSIFGQGWKVSSVLNGSTIEPKYSSIDGQNNLYTLSFFDTIYSPSIKSYGVNDLLLIKYSPNGTILWYKNIGSKLTDIPGGITVDNNSVYITGTYYDSCKFDLTHKLKIKNY
jgi:hypothetical protein